MVQKSSKVIQIGKGLFSIVEKIVSILWNIPKIYLVT